MRGLFDVVVLGSAQIEEIVEFDDDGRIGGTREKALLRGVVGVGQSVIVASVEDEMPNNGGELQA